MSAQIHKQRKINNQWVENIKNGESFSTFSVSVPRPGIEPGWVAPLVFETSASTDSAIWATVLLNCDAKVMLFVYHAKKNRLFLKKSFIYLPVSLKKSNFAGRLLSARESGNRYFRSLSLFTTLVQPTGRASAKRVSAEPNSVRFKQRSVDERELLSILKGIKVDTLSY